MSRDLPAVEQAKKDTIMKTLLLYFVLIVALSPCLWTPSIAGEDVNAKNKDGVTTLMSAAVEGNANRVKALLAAGADVKVKNNEGETALYMAALAGQTDCLKVLLAAGADMNAQNKDSDTPLMAAVLLGQTDCVKALLAAGADVKAKNNEGKTVADYPCANPEIAAALKAAGVVLPTADTPVPKPAAPAIATPSASTDVHEKHTDSNPTTAKMRGAADSFFQQGKYDQARAIYQELRKYLPEDNSVKVRYAECLYVMVAEKMVKQKAKPDNELDARLDEAASLFQEVADKSPIYAPEANYLRGKIAYSRKQYAEAEGIFQKVIESFPKSDFVPQAYYQLVLVYVATKKFERMMEMVGALTAKYPQNPLVVEAILRKAQYYYDNKKYIDAADIYKELLGRFPNNPKNDLITYRLATAYYRAGMTGDKDALSSAIQYYLGFAKNYKDNELVEEALYWAASAYQRQGNVRMAYTLLTRELISYPNGTMKTYAQRLRDKIKEDNPNVTVLDEGTK